MAHATDYQSRLKKKPITKTQRKSIAILQLLKFFDESKNWSENAVEEYCMLVYKDIGVNKLNYCNTRELWIKLNEVQL
jgi:hypothetical protein